jgi:paraquat-inducible protein B
MSRKTNPTKLGLFVVAGLLAFMVTTVYFGARSLRKETLTFKTYFNESVQGLEVGSPVKYRGVTIGTVSKADIAPDRRHVEVTMDLNLADVARLKLTEGEAAKGATAKVPPDLRTQLASQGITGVKFVQMDFFDEKSNPPEKLPFPVSHDTIPSAMSTLKSLEDSLVGAVNRIPELIDGIMAIMLRVSHILEDFDSKKVPDAAKETLGKVDAVLTSLDGTLKDLRGSNVIGTTARTVADIDKAVNKMSALLDKIDGDKGLVASATRTSDAIGDLGRNATGTTRELDATLREVREAAESIRNLTEALEKDPDMLLKGHARKRGK